MARKKPFSDWVFEAWEEMVLENGARLTVEERNNLWVSLFDRTFIEGRWVVGPADADLVASSGFYLCWEVRDFVGARTILQLYLQHPAITNFMLEGDFACWWVREACVGMLLGEEALQARRLQQRLATAKNAKNLLFEIHHHVGWFLEEPELQGVPTPELVALVCDLLRRQRATKSTLKKAESATNFGELRDALDVINLRNFHQRERRIGKLNTKNGI